MYLLKMKNDYIGMRKVTIKICLAYSMFQKVIYLNYLQEFIVSVLTSILRYHHIMSKYHHISSICTYKYKISALKQNTIMKKFPQIRQGIII